MTKRKISLIKEMDDKEKLKQVEDQLEKALQNEDDVEKTNVLLSTLIEAMIKTIEPNFNFSLS